MAKPKSDPVNDRLTELDIAPEAIEKLKSEFGVSNVEDLNVLTVDDFVAAGVKLVQARKAVAALVPVTPAAEAAATNLSVEAVLPAVPNDESWLNSLRAGGVLKVEPSSVIAVVRAGLAHRINYFDVPKKVSDAMETFAEQNDEPVSPEFFKIRDEITRHDYAAVFTAIPGLNGSWVTDGRKRELFNRVDRYFWPAVGSFNETLHGWTESWTQGAANPMMLMMALASANGGVSAPLPPGMMQPPDTGVLRDQADAVNDAINRVFAGTGVQIAAALAYDATKIKETIEKPELPAMVGAANREQMLKMLGIAVSSNYARLETNLTRYVLSILGIKDVPMGNDEYQYFSTLFMLGNQIPWGDLGAGGRVSGIGGGKL